MLAEMLQVNFAFVLGLSVPSVTAPQFAKERERATSHKP